MGTHFQGTPTEVRALNSFIKLMRASGSLGARLDRRIASYGLTESQFAVLEILLHLGPVNQRDLGRKLFTSGGNITMVVDNLERHGLVERRRDSDDRRFVTVHLTDAGRTLIADVFPGHVTEIVALMAALDPEEQDELGRLCKRLGLHAEARSGADRRRGAET